MEKLWFDSWESLGRTFIISITAYVALIVLLRISGKRTLSKMNAFDFIVTIALGSTLATVLLNKSVSLADGVLAMALLIFLQYAITWLSVRSSTINQLVKSTPSLLVYKGKMQHQVLRKQRIAEDEIQAFLRENDVASIDEAEAIVLETDGSLSLLKKKDRASLEVLSNLS
jgi:uncharacterized membrane protein YcaP (DUF421 family)